MVLRAMTFGLAVMFAVSVWAWCKACGGEAHAAESASPAAHAAGGNHDEAAARFRTNQTTHWRQVVLGR
jgi:hypothetical protein